MVDIESVRPPMKTNEIRQAFLDFFEGNDHQIVPSSSLVPVNDKTLLFTNAGMVQFKDIFLGQEPKKFDRATSSQKCIRAGGKHNDLENVGYTLRHHTFFEMLGNFSFGDYFKKDAIKLAWQFLTEKLNLEPDRLWITVYEDDDEARDIWIHEIGIEPERIAKLGEKDNFWSMAETGPCGPCSEIFYDHGDHIEGTPPGHDGDEGDRFVEIWNLVFMQFNRDSEGKLHKLPEPSVDTGMGLERIAAVLQGVNSNYEIDSFKNLIAASESLLESSGNTSHKVIADHIRSTCFLIADGISPSNEGRGYVLRRIMRRAIRHGYKIGARKPFLYKLASVLVEEMEGAYPEIKKLESDLEEIIKFEEKQFLTTLEKGIKILDEAIANHPNQIINGNLVFKLHDTYGFPYDLTADIAREKNLEIDKAGFDRAMGVQKTTSKAASSFKSEMPDIINVEDTEFLGYSEMTLDTKVIAIWAGQDKKSKVDKQGEYFFAVDQTPIYAESGGQVGDRGVFKGKNCSGSIKDCQKQGKVFLHQINLETGSLEVDDKISIEVDTNKRKKTESHHSATHLVHAALKHVLGDHVQQKGSLVDEYKLRFDFSHKTALTEEEIRRIEEMVNAEILKNVEVTTKIMDLDDAKKTGAESLFGEKYDEQVRVLSIGEDDFSLELCGGTHVKRTGDLGAFIIVSQSSVSSGVRRIEALSGPRAFEYFANLRSIVTSAQTMLNAPLDEVEAKIEGVLKQNKELKKTNKESVSLSVESEEEHEIVVSNENILLKIHQYTTSEPKVLRAVVDNVIQETAKTIFICLSVKKDTMSILCGISKDLQGLISAKDIVTSLTAKIDGKGGGRTEFAQGAGKPVSKSKFVSSIPNIIESLA